MQNRVAQGRFTLDGQTYQLSRNEGRHHLHGGSKGFDKKVWSTKPRTSADEVAVVFACSSESGDEGYPGALEAEVTYALTADDTLTIRYRATASDPTIVNLTNHALFNLRGAGTILDHSLDLGADAYTPVTREMIPTGDVDPVKGTHMDFRSPHRIGDRIDSTFDQLVIGGGYDHNYVLSAPASDAPTFAARLRDGQSGRTLEVWTTEPGIQLYTGNRLDGTLTGIGYVAYERFAGVALEIRQRSLIKTFRPSRLSWGCCYGSNHVASRSLTAPPPAESPALRDGGGRTRDRRIGWPSRQLAGR